MAPTLTLTSHPISDSVTDALSSRVWLLGTPIVITAAIAAASLLGPAWLPLSLIGALVGIELAVILNSGRRIPFAVGRTGIVETPFLLSHDQPVFEQYRRLADALLSVSQHSDPILRELALETITQRADEFDQLGFGNIVFTDTEGWRLAYEQLLRSPGTHRYRSVSCIKTAKYWDDEPGRRSTRLNYELAAAGTITIERIAIVADQLWPQNSPFPAEPIHRWLREQHEHGIKIRAARLSSLVSEPDLVLDSGIYGSRALGVQQLDDDGHTVQFSLSFDFKHVLAAEAKWERLSIYATSFEELLR